MTMKQWTIGLLNAALSGIVSGGVGLGLGIGWRKAMIILGASALASIAKWIPQHPIPGGETQSTISVETADGTIATATTTVTTPSEKLLGVVR